MKKILLIAGLILFLLPDNIYAQRPPSAGGGSTTSKIGYGKITGVVLDEAGEPIPYATVSLFETESEELVDGTVAEGDGKFTIKNIPEGTFRVNISFIGYQVVKKGPYPVTGKGENHDLGTVQLQPETKQLDEVVVQGQRDLIEDKVDRIVYNAEQDLTTAGGDATDVLRRVPLLSVDLDGNVSLRGSSNITVLIDGRPSTITAGSIADALRQIPADEIKSVEVITSPSARYDSEGSGGIINIITKKNNLQGGTLSINSGVGYRGSNLGLNAGYRRGKLGLSLGGNGRYNYNLIGDFRNEQYLKDENGILQSSTFQSATSDGTRVSARYNLGWDYSINKYNFIGGGVQFGSFGGRSQQFDRETFTVDRNGYRNQLENVDSDNLSNNVDVSLNYIRSFEEKDKEISFLTLFSQNRGVNDFTIDRQLDDAPNLGILNENLSFNREFTLQLDYVEPMGKDAKMEFGAKNIMRNVSSDFQLYTRQGEGEFTAVPGDNVGNNLDYIQNVTAAYVSGQKKFDGDITIQAGGRYEYTTIRANFSDEEELEIPDYGVFTPSLNISKKIGKANTVKFGYARRIQRPSLRFLNPNIDASNPLNISQGNPNLEPEFTNQYEVSYGTYGKGTAINFSAFMRNTNGSIQQVRETIGQDTLSTTFRNIGEEDAYGFNIFANYRAGKLSINGGVDAFYSVLSNNVTDPLYNASNSGIVYGGRLFGSYEFSKKWALQAFGFYRSPRVQLQGITNGFYIYSLSLNRYFNDKKGTLGIGANNFFNPDITLESEVNTAFISQYSVRNIRLLNVTVNFSYKIGKLTQRPTRRVRKVENDDLKEGGGDQSGDGMGRGND